MSIVTKRHGQTAAWIKMKLRMEVGLSPGHIVLDRDPATTGQLADTPTRGLDWSTSGLDNSRMSLVIVVAISG